MIFYPRKRRRGGKTGLDSIAIACCSQFLIGQGLRTLIDSWLEEKMFISMACRALFVMLPVFFFFFFIILSGSSISNWFGWTHYVYMDCVSLAILVNESKYRPLIICFAESALFFFFIFCYEHIYDEIYV